MLNEELRKRRDALGISRRELAGRLFITEQTLVNWEGGSTVHPNHRNAWMREIEKEETAVLKAIEAGGKA